MERLELVERDLQSHAKTITELTNRMVDYEKDQAVKEVEDEFLEKRIEANEKKLDAVYRLGWWTLTTFGAVFIAAAANFVARGGLNLVK